MQQEGGKTGEVLASLSLYYISCSSCGPLLWTSSLIYLQDELRLNLCFTKGS